MFPNMPNSPIIVINGNINDLLALQNGGKPVATVPSASATAVAPAVTDVDAVSASSSTVRVSITEASLSSKSDLAPVVALSAPSFEPASYPQIAFESSIPGKLCGDWMLNGFLTNAVFLRP